MKLTIDCICCQKSNNITCNWKDFNKWEQGASIQNAMPYLTNGERELLISGVCNNCFETMFEE